MKRALSAVVLLAAVALGAAALRTLWPASSDIQLSGVKAAPLEGVEATLAVFLTVENRGGADRLIGVRSPEAASTRLYSPESDGGIPIPAQSTPSLAADGAHVVLEGVTNMDPGRLVALTLDFEHAGAVPARARIADPVSDGGAASAGLFGIGGICEIGEGEPAPQVALSVKPLDGGRWRVSVLAEDFRFDRDLVDGPHVPGTGHAHLYAGGVKLMRLYEDQTIVGAMPPGEHVFRVTLSTNDHRAYVVDDQPVTAQATIIAD